MQRHRFLEKYHPEGSKALLTQSHERRRIFLEKYLVDLGNGLFDQVTFDQAIEEKPSVEEEKTEGKEGVSKATPETSELTEQQDKADDKGEAMALDEASDQGTPTEITDDWAKDLSSYMSPSLVIKSIPDTAKRAELLEVCN